MGCDGSRERGMRNHILEAAVYFILAVAVFDIFCTSAHRDEMHFTEQNMIAKTLITPDFSKIKVTSGPDYISSYITVERNDVSKLILFKVLGMLAAKSILMSLLNSKRQDMAMLIIGVMFLAQCVLLFILLM